MIKRIPRVFNRKYQRNGTKSYVWLMSKCEFKYLINTILTSLPSVSFMKSCLLFGSVKTKHFTDKFQPTKEGPYFFASQVHQHGKFSIHKMRHGHSFGKLEEVHWRYHRHPVTKAKNLTGHVHEQSHRALAGNPPILHPHQEFLAQVCIRWLLAAEHISPR